MKHSRQAILVGIFGISVALVLLLVYSFERTSWIFGLFEQWQIAAYAAAGVVEVAAVALLIGAAAWGQLDKERRLWASVALQVVLSIQALANLTAGYLHGGYATLNLLRTDAQGKGYWAAYVVASALWLVVNLAVPMLILCLSKLLEGLISLYIATEPAIGATIKIKPALAQHAPHAIEQTTIAIKPIVVAMPGTSEAVRDKACPKCGRELTAGQMGAAKRYGYCKACKGE